MSPGVGRLGQGRSPKSGGPERTSALDLVPRAMGPPEATVVICFIQRFPRPSDTHTERNDPDRARIKESAPDQDP